MKQQTSIRIESGTTEGYFDFLPPQGHWVSSVQIQCTHTYPMYVRLEYYGDDAELTTGYPEILFAGWLRATSGHYNAQTIALNKYIEEEKGTLRVSILNQSAATLIPILKMFYYNRPQHQTDHYNPEEHYGIWTLKAQWERITDAGTIGVTITPAAGSWIELEYGRLTAGFSAAEDVAVLLVDTAGTTIETLAAVNTTTGLIEFPSLSIMEDNTATTASSIGKAKDKLRINYPDSLRFTVSSCAATDDILVYLRCRLKDLIPTITFDTKSADQGGASPYSVVI